MSNDTSQKINILPHCETTDALTRFFANDSLGRDVQVNRIGRLVFVQTFPYSGVFASHLYVYVEESDGLRFLSFFRVRTQAAVGLRPAEDDSVEIIIGDERLCRLDQPPEN
jgi:hypothetical protein